MKAELEDRSLRYVDPSMYYKVSNLIKAKEQNVSSIDHVIDYITELFNESGLVDFEIKGRIKTFILSIKDGKFKSCF